MRSIYDRACSKNEEGLKPQAEQAETPPHKHGAIPSALAPSGADLQGDLRSSPSRLFAAAGYFWSSPMPFLNLSDSSAPMSHKIVRPRHAAAKLGVSRATLYRFIGTPGFPVAIQIGARAVGFLEGELDAWLASRRVTGAAA